MNKITLLVVFCLFLFLSTASAQKGFEPLPDNPISYLVTIEKDGSAQLQVPNSEESKTVTPQQLKDFFTTLAGKINSAQSTRGKDMVTIKSSPSVKIESLIAFIQSVRIPYTSKIRIEAGEGVFIRPPMKPRPGPITVAKPNPLFLLVSAGNDGKLRLNNEDQGTISDTSKLTDILKRIFREREANGVFREKSNEIESTVFLKLPLSMTWGDAAKVIRAMHDGGADPIGMQIESLDK